MRVELQVRKENDRGGGVFFTLCTITHGQVFRGTPNFVMFWFFPENGSISERPVNQGRIHDLKKSGGGGGGGRESDTFMF